MIGIDFDNTIVCYDRLIHRAARERKLIPEDIPPRKGLVRDYLRARGMEDAWTELQGYAYGAGMRNSEPFPGVLDFFVQCRKLGAPVFIISHKTREPFKGSASDLHVAAQRWLEGHGFYDPNRLGLGRERVYLELTKADKLKRIDSLGCRYFIDDLPEFLDERDFPRGAERILFDPGDLHRGERRFRRFSSWRQLSQWLDALR